MGKRKKKSGKSSGQTKKVNILLNRKHKNDVFCMLFHDRKALLSLFNAINGSNYTDPNELEITTIGDAIYIGHRKNDVSFLIDNYMNLYEAQSTRNPNMPLRGLEYFAQVYSGYIEQCGLDIYSERLLELPTPRYVVLYNGTAYEPERREYRLSDSFVHKQEKYCLECVATVLNINAGHNQELMEKCRLLYEYAEFVAIMRKYLKDAKYREDKDVVAAVDMAIEECMKKGILEEFLSRHCGEVCRMILTVYNEERRYRSGKQLGYETGWTEGEALGRAEGEAFGRAAGEALGRAEGEALGRAEGEALGRAEGEALGRAEGEALGRAEGEALGRAEDLLIVLEGMGNVPLELRERILEEKDIAVLKTWVKTAVQATSIEEFVEKIHL